MLGNSVGIGVRVIESSVTVGGVEYKAMKVVDVVKDAPAHKAGVLPGDFVVAIGNAQENTTLNVTGYDTALNRLRGEKGTVAEFAAYRPQGTDYELKFFSIVRDEYVDYSVTYKKVDADVDPTGKTGIVKINSFNHTTPTQFDEAIEALKAEGCEKFVFDLRDNPGGELTSIVAVLSRFLDEGKLVISTKDNADNVSETIVKVAVDDPNSEIDCPVSKQDIAKYKGLNCVVLCNENTASAAELFTACMKDYELATVVGKTTFGKGIMQSIIPLKNYGYDGAIKMTVAYYSSPKSDNYQDIGISPDIDIDLDPALSSKNVYKITDAEDNQLQRAIEAIKAANP
jgi:carboxyl-terminal processing protease